MKRTTFTVNLNTLRRALENAATFSKLMLIGSISALSIILLVSLGSIIQTNTQTSPIDSIKGLAASVSNQIFVDMLGMEVPGLQKSSANPLFSGKNLLQFMVLFLTDIHIQNPNTLIAHELPGMASGRTTVLRQGKVDNPGEPLHLPPPASVFTRDHEQTDQDQTKPLPIEEISPNQEHSVPGASKVAFIYQSHNTESFLPELTDKGITSANKAYDSKINVSLVGKRLADGLQKNGIGVIHSKADYPSMIKDFNFYHSYKYSQRTLQEASAANPDLEFYFDIHRDSLPRKKTTVNIGGKDYAQVHFIIGTGNPRWKENEAFANRIHERLEDQMPGISKGIYAKTEKEGDGVYNQTISPNAVLIEVGGPYNSLEECYRTADVLADIISDLIIQAQKVDAKP